jgi:dTDP-4-amino-4,6-dideoxygalactose transaminase
MEAMEEFIPVYKPLIDARTFDAAREALENGWLGMGSFVREFETRFQACLEAPDRHCVAVSTGTAALHLAMVTAGVGPGDEVITPSFNNIGDFQAILAAGARPVFCDIHRATLGIDTDRIEELITERTKMIIALHYNGIPCELDKVLAIGKRHDLRVVEDACHAVGSRIDGRMAGSFGDISCFSFDAVKTITCIDGGMIVVNAAEEAQRLQDARLLGMSQSVERLYANSRSWKYDVQAPGFRYHLANLHAAIGLSQLDRLDTIIENRRGYANFYTERLSPLGEFLDLPPSDFGNVGPFMYFILVKHGRREALIESLKEKGIDSGIHWQPGHRFTLFRDCRKGDLSVTEQVGDEVLTLPFHSFMSEEVLERVVAGVTAFFQETAS